jgi:hypothetical protein
MRSTWRVFGCLTLLIATLLIARPAVAADPEKKTPDLNDVLDRLEKIEKELNLKLGDFQRTLDEQFRFQNSTIRSGLDKELAEMKQQIGQLRKDVDKLSASKGSTSLKPIATGTVRIKNTSMQPVTVVVNGQPHNVEPGTMVELTGLTLGQLTYEVPGSRDAGVRVRTLRENDPPLEITVVP